MNKQKNSYKKYSDKHIKKISTEQFPIHNLTQEQKQTVNKLQELGFTNEESYFLSLNTKERIENAVRLLQSGLESEYAFTLSNKENNLFFSLSDRLLILR